MATETEYQAKVRNKAVPAVYLLLQDRSKILMMLRHNTGYQDGNWDVPSGHVEESELPSEAMKRETREEIGIGLFTSKLQLVHTSYRPKHDKTGDRTDFFFLAYARDCLGEPRICEPNKCIRLDWFYPFTLPTNTVPHVRNAIQCWRQKIPYAELGLDWIKANGLYTLEQ